MQKYSKKENIQQKTYPNDKNIKQLLGSERVKTSFNKTVISQKTRPSTQPVLDCQLLVT